MLTPDDNSDEDRESWREDFYQTVVVGCSLGGLPIAITLGILIVVDNAFLWSEWWPSYAGYGLLVALNRLKHASFRIPCLLLSLHTMAWSSLFALGLDTGPILIAFISIIITGILANRTAAIASLTATSLCVGLTRSFVNAPDIPGLLSAVGFAGTALAGIMLILFLVRILERQSARHLADLQALQREQHQRMAAEATLLETRAQLDESLRFEAIGRVAGGVAHEFNNLLQVIITWTEALKSAQSSREKEECIERIREASFQAGEVTSALLAIARKDSEAATVFDLQKQIHHWRGSWTRVVPSSIQLNVVSEPVGRVQMSEGALQQALFNLIRNAMDPEVAAQWIRVSVIRSEDPDRPIQISVEDNGVGMNQATLGRVFEPFFTSKGVRGTGLGLSIVRGTIEQNNGTISIESEEGVGTRVFIRLPVAIVELAEEAATRTQPEQPSTWFTKILFAEDEPSLRRGIARMLTRRGYTILLAEDGDQALDLIRQDPEPCDLLLIDARMPGASSLEVIRSYEIANPSGMVLVCSGNVQDPTLRAYIQEHQLPLLTKPFSRAELYRALDSL